MKTNVLTRLEQKNSKGEIKFINLALDGNILSKIWGENNGTSELIEKNYSLNNPNNKKLAESIAMKDYNLIIEQKIKEGYKIIYSDTHQVNKGK